MKVVQRFVYGTMIGYVFFGGRKRKGYKTKMDPLQELLTDEKKGKCIGRR